MSLQNVKGAAIIFGKKARLKKIKRRNGSKIHFVDSKEIAKVKPKNKKRITPQIVETKLESYKGRITHLHFDGWRDKSALPSENLLMDLLDKIESLSSHPDVPVAINCKGGAGRSGMIGVSFFLRRFIDAEVR